MKAALFPGAGRRAGAVLAGAAAALVGLTASPAFADWADFVPRPFENHAWIETYGSWERDVAKGSARGRRWEDSFLREKLTVQSTGFSYDPRFLQYKLSLAGAAKQEDYRTSVYATPGWQARGAFEYDSRFIFLPEHDYNLQIFSSRREPVYRQRSATNHNAVLEDYGATVRYQAKPWFFDTTYLDTTLHSVGSRSTVRHLTVNGEYFHTFVKGWQFSVNGKADPSWYEDSRGLGGTSRDYLLGSLVDLKRLRLDSSLGDSSFQQQRRASDRYETDQFAWRERMTLYLPWNFRSQLSWRLHDDNSDVSLLSPQSSRHFDDRGNSVEMDVIHRLYRSVDTRYRLLHNNRSSSGGNSSLLSHALSMNYTKRIAWGRFLSDLHVGRADLDNRGFADVVNDPYLATAVPGTFALHQENVNADLIVVTLRSQVPPFETIPLQRGIHYMVNTAVEPFEVQILALPPEFTVPGSYDVYVSYSRRSGQYQLETDTLGASVSYQLFGNRVAPFFRYQLQRSDAEGTYPGVPIDSDSWSAGLRLQYGPWRARGEYQELDWSVNPYRAWRSELQYVGAVTRSITAYGTASYLLRHYLGGDPPYRSADFTEQTATVSGSLTRQFFARNLYLSIGGSWSRLEGDNDAAGAGSSSADAWSANSSLVWHIAMLDVTFGVAAYGSTSHSFGRAGFERDHQLIFLNLKRQIL